MFDKLKSRTEWQAYLLTVVSLFLNHFLDLKATPETLLGLVGSAVGYGISRGLAKQEPSGGTIAKDGPPDTT